MADIDSLKTSFTDLNKEEAYKLLINIRKNRRDVYEEKQNRGRKKTTTKTKKKKPSKKKVEKMLGSLTKAQAQALLDKLQNN